MTISDTPTSNFPRFMIPCSLPVGGDRRIERGEEALRILNVRYVPDSGKVS